MTSYDARVDRVEPRTKEPLGDKDDGLHPRRPAAPRSKSDSTKTQLPEELQLPTNYDFPFNIPSLLVPILPTQDLQQRYFPVQKRIKAHPSPPSRKPETLKEALRRAERMTEYSDLPTNYDFPFGIPSLLIDTFSTWLPSETDAENPPQPSNPQSSKSRAKQFSKEKKRTKHEKSKAVVFSGSSIPSGTDAPISTSTPAPVSDARSLLSRDLEDDKTRLKSVHVLFSNIYSTYIAHSLSLVQRLPPVTFLIPRKLQHHWEQEGRQLRIMRGDTVYSSGTLTAEAFDPFITDDGEGHIDQLVVTSRPGMILKELAPLARRIDSRTVLCLVQDGLGIPEFLNQRLFQNPASRPLYVMGHMTLLPRHIRSGSNWYRFTIGEALDHGRLNLSPILGEEDKYPSYRKHPPARAIDPLEHFLYAMSTDKKLDVKRSTTGHFLQLKLPKMVFLAAVDSLVAMLDCEYGELCRLGSGLDLLEKMISEIGNVIVNLPELEHNPGFRTYVGNGSLRGDILGKLRGLHASRESHLRLYVLHGSDIDIEHTSGWFIKRGRELGLELPVTWSVMESVKAKAKLLRKRNQAMIHF